ncbi:hypothetical protein [Labilibaculum manganireducens]|uniref:hypothetical protein n=1 Tax=Labilibaculum manganireducens TaxID=1940525 RepID=UPI0029F4C2B6|nr:hypothetical protein [Labilibaculum manganireducens]
MKNKGLRYYLYASFGVGNIGFLLCRRFYDRLTDFELGVGEGISFVFILTGAAYLIYCAINKQHPLQEKSLECQKND